MADTPDYVNGEPEPIHNFNPSVHDLIVNDAKHGLLAFSYANRHTGKDVTRNMVIDLVRDRKAYGFNKYGTPLQSDNGRDFMKDATEEAIDLLAYIRQGIEEHPGDTVLHKAYTAAAESLALLLLFKRDRDAAAVKAAEFSAAFTAAKTAQSMVISDLGLVPYDCDGGAKCGGTGFVKVSPSGFTNESVKTYSCSFTWDNGDTHVHSCPRSVYSEVPVMMHKPTERYHTCRYCPAIHQIEGLEENA